MVSLAILDKKRTELLSCRDDGAAMQLLAGYLEGVTNRDSTMPSNTREDIDEGKDEKEKVGGVISFYCATWHNYR